MVVHGPSGLGENVPCAELERNVTASGVGTLAAIETVSGGEAVPAEMVVGAAPMVRVDCVHVRNDCHARVVARSRDVDQAEGVLARRPARARSRRLGVGRFCGVTDRGRESIEELAGLRREVARRHARRVARRPREPPVVARLPGRGSEVAHRVGLGGDVRAHLIHGHHRPAPGRLPWPRGVRQWAVGRLEERACCLDRSGACVGEHELVLQVVVEVLPPVGDRLTRNRVCSEVSVDLLRPVADVRGHVRPERAVSEPVLQGVLVGGQVARALTEADDEDAPARGPAAVSLVQPAEELPDVRPRVAVAAPDGGRQLVERPRVSLRDVVARRGHALAGGDTGGEPRAARGGDPPRPRREVDLRHGVEARPERSDSRRLVAPEGGLVRHERRNRDVVLGTRRSARRRASWRGEASPTPRRTRREADGTRPANALPGLLRDQRLPQGCRLRRLQRRNRASRRRRCRRADARAAGAGGQSERREDRETEDGRGARRATVAAFCERVVNRCRGAVQTAPWQSSTYPRPQWTSAFRQSSTSLRSAPGLHAFRKSACAE